MACAFATTAHMAYVSIAWVREEFLQEASVKRHDDEVKMTKDGKLAEGHRYMTGESAAAGSIESHGEPNPLGSGERYLTEAEERKADHKAAKHNK